MQGLVSADFVFWLFIGMALASMVALALIASRGPQVVYVPVEMPGEFSLSDYEDDECDLRCTEESADELVKARQDLVAGRIEDAKWRLDRALSDIDSSWRTRA